MKLLEKDGKGSNITLGALSIHDITPALEKKKLYSREEVQNKNSKEIHQYTNLFLDDNLKVNER